jgi:uncharacterized membrane-anchored protein YhcB (DUF1043 family)
MLLITGLQALVIGVIVGLIVRSVMRAELRRHVGAGERMSRSS